MTDVWRMLQKLKRRKEMAKIISLAGHLRLQVVVSTVYENN